MNKLTEKIAGRISGTKSSRHHYFRMLGVRIAFFFVLCMPNMTQASYATFRKYYDFVGVNGSNGMPMTGITALTFDDDGFVWGASRMGVVRATPSGSKIYDLPVATSDVMQMKLAYNKGMLAAASQNGQVFRYNRIKDRIEQWFSLSDTLGTKDWVSNIIIDSDGKGWISTSDGLFTFSDGRLGRFTEAGRGYSYILPIDGERLFGIADGRIFTMSAGDRLISGLPGEFGKYVSCAAYDQHRYRVLMGTYDGELWEYDLNKEKLSRISDGSMPEFIIRSILVPEPGVILIGMEGKGIVVFDSDKGKISHVIKDDIDNPSSLRGNSVFAMTADRQGRLWVATTSAGLQYSDTDGGETERIVHRYNTSSSLHNNEINYLLADKGGNLWVATNDGVSRRDASDGTWRQLYGGTELSALSLAQGRQGEIYISTYGKGIYVVDPVSCRELRHFSKDDSDIFGKGAYVFSCFTDSDGDIWFGGVKGNVVCYSPVDGSFRKYESHPVFCFAEAEPGIILTGGGDGLVAIDKKSGKTETLLSDNVVQQIFVDGPYLWICTSGKGVIRMDRKTGATKTLTVNDGLQSNFTRSVVKDGTRLWIGTALGMSCYDMEKEEMLRLPGKDIFTADAFRENSSAMLADGKLSFGTNNGIVLFDPESILGYRNAGRIYFSDIRVSGQSIRNDFSRELTVPIDSLQQLTLDYPRNSFTLSMLPLGNVGFNVMYSWRLDGIDREWTELSPSPYVNYINLKPGTYYLTVRMYDGGLVSERQLSISVNPPFWNTWWFRLLVLVAVVLLVVIMVRQYMRSLRRRHAFEKLLLSLQITEDFNKKAQYDCMEEEYARNDGECAAMKGGEIGAAENLADSNASQVEEREHGGEDSKAIVIDDEFLNRAIECVKANISNEAFGKGDFASAMMISQSLLYKKIKAMTDMSVVEFIRSIRLNHAMTLLGSGRYNVSEVSEMCGFSTSAYFSRVFKEGFGKSPSEVIPKRQ